MMITDHIENAYRSLSRNRTRSILTTMGIAIGVASVVAILALTSGVSKVIGSQVDALDGNLVVVRPGLLIDNPTVLTGPVIQNAFSTSSLTELDVQALEGIDGINAIAPIMTIDSRLTSDTNTTIDTLVVATQPDLLKVNQLTVDSGQFIDTVTDKQTIVLGLQLAVNLFGTDKPIGRTLTVRGEKFTVIGVLKATKQPINYSNIDFDNAAIVNLEAGKLFHQGRSQIQQINIQTNAPSDIPRVSDLATQALLKTHLGEQDFSVLSGKDVATPTSRFFDALSEVLVAISAVALFVGGIGVMNIMLVGVAERTREIGIRKAVGASNGNIMTQFLIEALFVSMIGGVIGYFIGCLAAFIISTMLISTPDFNWYTVLAATVMSIGTGIVFGLYPAIKASRKDTITSLRQYH